MPLFKACAHCGPTGTHISTGAQQVEQISNVPCVSTHIDRGVRECASGFRGYTGVAKVHVICSKTIQAGEELVSSFLHPLPDRLWLCLLHSPYIPSPPAPFPSSRLASPSIILVSGVLLIPPKLYHLMAITSAHH